MNRFASIILAMVVLVSVAGAQEARKASDNPKAVLPVVRRQEVLKRAAALLEIVPADSASLTTDMIDPFNPTIKRRQDKVAAPVEVSTEVLLARAADGIRPTGTMLIGTEPYLLLDGRRYKSGDTISVTVDGLGVQITVTSIERNSYTLRLNDQELRREFK